MGHHGLWSCLVTDRLALDLSPFFAVFFLIFKFFSRGFADAIMAASSAKSLQGLIQIN